MMGSNSCNACSAGKSSAAQANICVNCRAGKFTPSAGLCTDCPAGTYSSAGAGSCSTCAVGKFAALPPTYCIANPSHVWDFRTAASYPATSVLDSAIYSSPIERNSTKHHVLVASAKNGASIPNAAAGGMVFDGVDDFVQLETWRFGGAASFEVMINYADVTFGSAIFDFSSPVGGYPSDYVLVGSNDMSSVHSGDLFYAVGVGSVTEDSSFLGRGKVNSTSVYVDSLEPPAFWDATNQFIHAVFTINSRFMACYKNGAIISTTKVTKDLPVRKRAQHIIGKLSVPGVRTFKGVIAYMRIWNGVALTQSDVSVLYNRRLL